VTNDSILPRKSQNLFANLRNFDFVTVFAGVIGLLRIASASRRATVFSARAGRTAQRVQGNPAPRFHLVLRHSPTAAAVHLLRVTYGFSMRHMVRLHGHSVIFS
jgi:hypothetical protein